VALTGLAAARARYFLRNDYAHRGARNGTASSIIRVPETTRIEDTLVRGYSQLALETPARPRDAVLRLLDVVLVAIFLIVALPLMLVIGIVIAVSSGRPVFYRGERVGRGGHIFTMLKFRTLNADAESRLGPYLGEELVQRTKTEFTPIGRWLKATQLDEIPQFLNVLRGDMSLVGPRPIRPRFFEELARELPAYWQRLVVRPGLTGFAQVRRGYETSMAEKLAHDLEWIADRSVGLYLRTVAATGWRMIRQAAHGLLHPG
jgi:lipopolysaccharide/colanic/teichoic acid biosynthesis glycosyltransferase